MRRARELAIGGSVVKSLPANAGDTSLIPGLGRSSGEGKGYPLQYSGLKNSMDCIVFQMRVQSDKVERPLAYHSDATGKFAP